MPFGLPIAGGIIVILIPFPRILTLCERQIASSRIWTQVTVFISYNECLRIYIYIYIYIYTWFQDSWKFTMLLLYILWDNWPIFMISGSNVQLQHELEYTLLKPDCHSWWISKMQSGRKDTLEERCAIKFCFKLGKNASETYRMLQTAFEPSCMNRASVFEWHKDSRKAGSLWWMMRGVRGVRK